MNKNYHCHTFRCRHAVGEDEDYVKAAIEAGFETIGFSDHCAWRFADESYISGIRMTEAEIPTYVQSIRNLKEKYRDKIEILLGFEAEYFPAYMPWMKETLDAFGFDYVILGHHFHIDENGGIYNGSLSRQRDVENYADDLCAAMDAGLYSYVAHPDLYMNGWQKFDKAGKKAAEKIISKAIETETPLEYNLLGLERNLANGFEGYPYTAFWTLAGEMGATGIMGVDAHRPEAYLNKELIEMGERALEKAGVKVIDEIKLFDNERQRVK